MQGYRTPSPRCLYGAQRRLAGSRLAPSVHSSAPNKGSCIVPTRHDVTHRMRKRIRDREGAERQTGVPPPIGPGRVPEPKEVLTCREIRNLNSRTDHSERQPSSTSPSSVQALETHGNNEANQKWGTRKSWGSQTSLRPGAILTGA